jgi:hypothetical protein
MALAPPANRAERRSRLKEVVLAYNANPATFNLNTWFYGPAGPGAAETVQNDATMGVWFDIEPEIFHSLHWHRRATPLLVQADDRAQTRGFYGSTGPTRDSARMAAIGDVLGTESNV